MKKLGIFIFIFTIFSLVNGGMLCADAAEPIPVEFRKFGGGQYIYCNNPENITPRDLSTKENPSSTYMMKNEGLKPDNYSVFFCFYNSTDFDVEPDIELKGKNTEITINSIGFYLPGGDEYWDCLGAWSDLWGVNIRTLNGQRQYVPYKPARDEFPIRLHLSEASEWLSSYIYNYDVVRPMITFLMLVDFTVDEGEADVNFAALKHYGVTGDRSNHNPAAASGSYFNDTSVKGIDTETLPMVEADLNVVIDSEIKNGENIMVDIKNQFHNGGNTAPYWMTNINPSRDEYMFSKNVAVGSDMLSLSYADDTKLNYYGRNIPISERDNIWHFDIYHHNMLGYETGMPHKRNDHIPNAYSGTSLDIYNLPNLKWEFNLGNFGVTNRYNLSVTNTDNKKRTLNYILDTQLASNILIVRDEEGTMVNPYTLLPENAYALSKGITGNKKEDCMFSVSVAPGETKKYILDVTLPTNCYGGMLNILRVDDHKYISDEPDVGFPDYTEIYDLEHVFFNGKTYMKWENGKLYEYVNGDWKRIYLPESAQSIFDGHSDNYRIVKTKDGYEARFSGWDEYADHINTKDTRNTVYSFDEDFNLMASYKFNGYISDMTFAGDSLYVKADKVYVLKDNGKRELAENQETVPVTDGKRVITSKNNDFYLKEPMETKLCYEGIKPREILSAGDMFYYVKSWRVSYDDSSENVISVSSDGLNWTDLTLPPRFSELCGVIHFGGKIHINCKYETFAFDEECLAEAPVYVVINNEMLSFLTPPELVNDRTMVPMRFFFEKLGEEVTWVDETYQIIVKQDDNDIVFQIGSDKAYVNGQEETLDSPAYLKDDKTMIPLRFLSETLGYDVQWDEAQNIAIVSDMNV